MDVPSKAANGRKSKKRVPCAPAASRDLAKHSQSTSRTHFMRRNIFTGTYEKVDEHHHENSTAEGEPSGRPSSGRGFKVSHCELPLMDTAAIIADLEFLLSDEAGRSQGKRIQEHLKALVRSTINGFCIRDLRGIVIVGNYLVDYNSEQSGFLSALLENASHVVWLAVRSDTETYWNYLVEYYNFVGYLLMRLEEDAVFELAAAAACEQLERDAGARRCACPPRVRRAAAAGTALVTAAARMPALASARRFPQYLRLALLLASVSEDICRAMVTENILENLLYRFNPYFPEKDLPLYDINPQNPHDDNIQLGESSIHLSSVLSLLLILLHNMTRALAPEPDFKKQLKCPDSTALRSWAWAFRLECRTQGRNHERNTMVAITMALLACYGDRLTTLADGLMPDLLSLAVLTEVPAREGWLGGVRFDNGRADVEFKKLLVYTSVLLLKIFPRNVYLVESRHWLVGLMYLVDPCLYQLRRRWDEPLFAELRKAALMAMVAVLPLCPPHLAIECGLIRRILWYIEWYTVSPFDTALLYWSVRLVRAAGGVRGTAARRAALDDLADSHALVVIIQLCHVLLEGGERAPTERAQAVLGQCLRALTSAAEQRRPVLCVVYPRVQWPVAVTGLAETMLDALLRAPDRSIIVTQRWALSVLNFIWESIMWKDSYRLWFISNNGIYKILDLISCSGAAVQCMGLALVCEAARAGQAVAQLVTWRARPAAAGAGGTRRGAALARLLAGIARDECRATGVRLHPETGVIQEEEFPLANAMGRREMEAARSGDSTSSAPRGLACHTAAGLAGSRLSKIYSLLQMMSDDLALKVSTADETYNMYKNVSLSAEDEVMLVLCTHYQACKMGEVWGEVHALLAAGRVELPAEDAIIMDDFLQLYKGWAREIKRQQEEIYEIRRKKDVEEEASLHALLSRCRLTTALDGLRELRGCVRASDAARRGDAQLRDALAAQLRRQAAAALAAARAKPIVATYEPPIDVLNIIGQNIKVHSIPQELLKTTDHDGASCGC